MEIDHIKRIYDTMEQNDFELLELDLGSNNKLRLQLEQTEACDMTSHEPTLDCDCQDESQTKTQIDIRSDKVGVFSFAGVPLNAGDKIKKNETLGFVKGISFEDRIKCSVSGVISKANIKDGDIVDFGHLLFVVNLEDES